MRCLYTKSRCPNLTVMALSVGLYAHQVVVFLALVEPCLARRSDNECVSDSFAVHNLTALAPEVIIDSSKPDNNAAIFQLFNPVTQVSGECAAHGATLAPDKALGEPEIWYNCFVESRDPSITAHFQFDSVLNQLTVNETWTCGEGDEGGTLQCVSQVNFAGKCSKHQCLMVALWSSSRLTDRAT